MLRKLTPQHRDVMLRLVAGDKPQKIATELGITPQTVLLLQKDPLFAAELHDLERSAKEALLERISAMEILEQTCNDAANVFSEAVGTGEVGGVAVSPKTKLDAAYKVLSMCGLDRSKQRKEEHTESLPNLVIIAYERGRETYPASEVVDIQASSEGADPTDAEGVHPTDAEIEDLVEVGS